MPRKPKKPQPQAEATKSYDEFADDGEGIDEDAISVENGGPDGPGSKLRDWRDVEKYKEERALRRMIDDELDLD